VIVHCPDNEADKPHPKASLYLQTLPPDNAIFHEDALSPDAKHIDNLVMEYNQPMKISRTTSSNCYSPPSKKSAVPAKPTQ